MIYTGNPFRPLLYVNAPKNVAATVAVNTLLTVDKTDANAI